MTGREGDEDDEEEEVNEGVLSWSSQKRMNERLSAASYFVDAARAFRKIDPGEAIKMYGRAIVEFAALGRFLAAASVRTRPSTNGTPAVDPKRREGMGRKRKGMKGWGWESWWISPSARTGRG